MPTLLLVAIAGFLAQLVDGSLGMGFGVTAAAGLLAVGTAPVVVSSSVHVAKIGTAVVSGAAHWRLNNVDWRVVGWLAVPGAIGGFAGALALSSVPQEVAATVMGAMLFLLGLYVLAKFSVGSKPVRSEELTPAGRRWLTPLGGFAGFVDAIGGGGWGPVTTSTLLSTGRMLPHRTIGSVVTSELIVSLGAVAGFLFTSGGGALSGTVVTGLLIGGVIAAPLAAWLVRKLPMRALGVGAGGLIVVTNVGTVLDAVGVPGTARTVVSAVMGAVWLAGLVWAFWTEFTVRRAARAVEGESKTAPAPAASETADSGAEPEATAASAGNAANQPARFR